MAYILPRANKPAFAAALALLSLSTRATASEPLPPPPETVELHEANWTAGALYFAYGKDFQGCAALVRDGWEAVSTEGLFCEVGADIAVEADGGAYDLTPGESLRLCHPDNYLLCSEALILEDLTPPPRLEVQQAEIEGESLILHYAKDVEGCALLMEPGGMLVAPPGILCGVGEALVAELPLEETAAYPGLLVMLCLEGGEVCGEPTMIEGGDDGAGCEGEASLYSAALLGNVLLMLAVPLIRRRRPYHRRYI